MNPNTLHRFPTLFLALGLLCLADPFSQIAAQEYAKEVEEIRTATKLTLNMEETENFLWVYTVATPTLKKVSNTGEAAFKVFKEVSGITSFEEIWGPSREGNRKCIAFVLKNKLDYRKILAWYEEKYDPYKGFKDVAGGASYITQPAPRVAIFIHALPVAEADLTYVIAHEVGHLCIQRYAYHNNHLPPWLEEGFALWMEARVMKGTNCYCFSGGYGDSAGGIKDMSKFEWTKWRELNTRLVGRSADKNLKDLLRLRLNELSSLDAAKAASIVDFLVAKDSKKFVLFLRKMKGAWPQGDYDPAYKAEHLKAQERGLKDSFDWDVDTLDREWRAWAKKGMK
ncbi:MAG TPA: hypothetical protein PKA37_13975 [Planctomycetota bacterium]|nr:hypothetical protein [Planctomycetota bacterium]